MKLRHVVYSHREGFRWYFIDTQHPEKGAHLFLSLNPSGIVGPAARHFVCLVCFVVNNSCVFVSIRGS